MKLNSLTTHALKVTLIATMASSGVQAEVYELETVDTDLVGELQIINSNYVDTFIDIGRQHNLGYEELRAANPEVDPWLPGENTPVLLPTEFVLPRAKRSGVVVNLPEFRIYYFYTVGDQNYVATVPASVGRMDWESPLGLTNIVAKAYRPNWYPPESVRQEYADDGRTLARVIPAGPDNPLGEYALRLGLPGYLIHGTNKPAGVGMRVTHGCIRLFPEDIEWLYPKVGVQTPVRFINQPLKFGWKEDGLYLEAHPVLEKADDSESLSMTLITQEYVRATDSMEVSADWELIAQTFRESTGVPVLVGSRVRQTDQLTLNLENPDD